MAARNVILSEGIENMALSRVAEVAGIAKGTLLYHFKTKESLLKALLNSYTEHLREELTVGLVEMKETSKAPVASAFAAWYKRFLANADSPKSFGLAILSYAAHNEQYRQIVRDWYEEVFEMIRASADSEDVLFGVLAIEGLFYLQHFELNVLSKEEAVAVADRVIAKFAIDK